MVFAPVALSDAFPIRGDIFAQGDRPITYLHSHDCLELGYCYDGAGVFVIGNKVLPFQAGAVSFITPAEFHLAQSIAGTQSRWAWIYLDPLRLLQSSQLDPEFLRIGHLAGKSFRNLITPQIDPLIRTLMQQLVIELREKPRGYEMASKGLVWSLLVRFHRLAPKRKKAGPTEINRAISRMAPALDLIATRYPEQLSITEWARSCHVSPTHFRRQFRQALGKSPHQYLTELRVRMAATRLHAGNEKIVTLAQEVGFTTLSSFNRAFRRAMKMTPRQWRNQA